MARSSNCTFQVIFGLKLVHHSDLTGRSILQGTTKVNIRQPLTVPQQPHLFLSHLLLNLSFKLNFFSIDYGGVFSSPIVRRKLSLRPLQVHPEISRTVNRQDWGRKSMHWWSTTKAFLNRPGWLMLLVVCGPVTVGLVTGPMTRTHNCANLQL
jgi:hypothetical protein